jgi:hypothetical protein
LELHALQFGLARTYGAAFNEDDLMGVIRTWRCLNSRCAKSFDSWEPNPACPSCKCVRVDWQPAGGHIAGVSRGGDAELRALADVFRMNDMNSAEEGRAAKKVKLPEQSSPSPGNLHTFAGGFSAAINPAAGAQCVPTANKIDYKVKAGTDAKLGPGGLGMPGIRSNTAVEAAHKS